MPLRTHLAGRCFRDPHPLRMPYLYSDSVHVKISPLGTSLVVYWLRLQDPDAGGPGSVPVQGTMSHMLQLRLNAAK